MSVEKDIQNWLAYIYVNKGDTPGHPFHGNQYVDLTTGGSSSEAAEAARGLIRTAMRVRDDLANRLEDGKAIDTKELSEIARRHGELADRHAALAERL